MNRKAIKIISILLMVVIIAMTLSTSVFASTDAKDYTGLNQFTGSKDTTTVGVFQSFIATLINLVQVVGTAVAIIMLIVMAIKYISAAPSEKAELKKSMTVYVVGAIVLFAATGILQVVKNFAKLNISASEITSGYVQMVDDEYFG